MCFLILMTIFHPFYHHIYSYYRSLLRVFLLDLVTSLFHYNPATGFRSGTDNDLLSLLLFCYHKNTSHHRLSQN